MKGRKNHVKIHENEKIEVVNVTEDKKKMKIRKMKTGGHSLRK